MMKNKKDYYLEIFSLFLTDSVPMTILDDFMKSDHDDGYTIIADFIGMHMKPEISEWSTCLGIVEAVEIIYNEAVMNGNIKDIML